MAQYLRRYRVEPAAIVPNGVDTETFRPVDDAEQQQLRAHLGWKESKVFVVVGHLIALKNPLAIVQAWAQAQLADARLVFVGSGDQVEDCMRVALTAGPPVQFVGRVENVAPFVQAADYIVSASHSEGMPLALLEGMASGARCLASDIQAHQDLAAAYPQSIVLFDAANTHELAHLMRQCSPVSQGERFMRHLRLVGQHSAQVMARRYMDLYGIAANEASAQRRLLPVRAASAQEDTP